MAAYDHAGILNFDFRKEHPHQHSMASFYAPQRFLQPFCSCTIEGAKLITLSLQPLEASSRP